MLLFILICLQRVPKKVYFKTSYVTVYLVLVFYVLSLHTNFKTSYVTVYRAFGKKKTVSDSFQNIVCYCLSKSSNAFCKSGTIFQNIVCYCLSLAGKLLADVLEAFQNIVCYCLSIFILLIVSTASISKHRMLLFIIPPDSTVVIVSNFKTSYVTVYQTYAEWEHWCGVYFKTSYVTVYQF